jgi:hypothetical protein
VSEGRQPQEVVEIHNIVEPAGAAMLSSAI